MKSEKDSSISRYKNTEKRIAKCKRIAREVSFEW